MAAPLRDPKSLTAWMRLDYFRHPGRLRRLRRAAIWLSLILGVVVLGVTLGPATHSIHQAGPLSEAHAMLANDCGHCHQEFLRPAQRFFGGDSTLRTVSDSVCKNCHDGPIHKEEQAGSPACASCHREHRGTRLVRPTDSHCTSCHADLPASMKDPGKCKCDNVTAFASDHPEFALFRKGPAKDPGTIAFNHHAHLGPEGTPGPGRKMEVLTCSSCHKPDAERRYFQPIHYREHCARCHPLSVQVAGNVKDPRTEAVAREFRKQPALHDKPVTVRADLNERFTRFVVQHPTVLKSAPPETLRRQVPGRIGRGAPPGEAQAWVNYQVRQAERMLFDLGGGCRYCHRAKGARSGGELPEYELSGIKNRWFEESRFRHESHHVLRCGECHGDVAASRSAADVLLPKIDDCRRCHNPRVGARSDCVECHAYHDRTKGRGLEGLRTIEECTGRSK